jgi:hypothetical protein
MCYSPDDDLDYDLMAGTSEYTFRANCAVPCQHTPQATLDGAEDPVTTQRGPAHDPNARYSPGQPLR